MQLIGLRNAVILSLIGLLIGGFFLAFSGSKLYIMAQIRGWLPGAREVPVVITQKLREQGKYEEVYWIGWTDKDIQQPGNHRINMPKEKWNATNLGDGLTLIYTGSSNTPNIRDGIYADNDNFLVDGIILLSELTVVAFILVRLLRLYRLNRFAKEFNN